MVAFKLTEFFTSEYVFPAILIIRDLLVCGGVPWGVCFAPAFFVHRLTFYGTFGFMPIIVMYFGRQKRNTNLLSAFESLLLVSEINLTNKKTTRDRSKCQHGTKRWALGCFDLSSTLC